MTFFTLTYIFEVLQAWLCNEAAKICHILPYLLYSIYSSGLILLILLHILAANSLYSRLLCLNQQIVYICDLAVGIILVDHQSTIHSSFVDTLPMKIKIWFVVALIVTYISINIVSDAINVENVQW